MLFIPTPSKEGAKDITTNKIKASIRSYEKYLHYLPEVGEFRIKLQKCIWEDQNQGKEQTVMQKKFP